MSASTHTQITCDMCGHTTDEDGWTGYHVDRQARIVRYSDMTEWDVCSAACLARLAAKLQEPA